MLTRSGVLTVVLGATLVTACGTSTEPAAQTVPITSSPVASTAPAPTTAADSATTVAEATTTTATAAESADTVAPGAPETTAPAADTTVPQPVPLAAWQTLSITDVGGVTFSFADFAGTPVFVETFATWCPKCRAQLKRTNEAALAAGGDALFIALSVETDLDASDVATYAQDNDFGAIRFAVVDPEMLAALVDAFGNSIANPPSTPTFVIASDGTVGGLSTGDESSDEIAARLLAAG